MKFKFILSLILAFLSAEILTRFVFYPNSPITRLSFRVWFAQKKRKIATLLKKQKMPPPQVPPPVFYQPPSPLPSHPQPPFKPPTPKPTPKPTPRPTPKSPPPTLPPSPTLQPTTPTPKPSPFDINQEIKEVVRLINEERAKRNLENLDTPPLLMEAAQLYIEDLGPYLYQNKKCGHGVPDKGLIWDYAKRTGYRGTPVGEVAMCGGRTPKETVSGWMNSSGHRSIIMSPKGKHIGVGVWPVPGDPWGRKYWVGGVYY